MDEKFREKLLKAIEEEALFGQASDEAKAEIVLAHMRNMENGMMQDYKTTPTQMHMQGYIMVKEALFRDLYNFIKDNADMMEEMLIEMKASKK